MARMTGSKPSTPSTVLPRLYRKAAPVPTATRLSIVGDLRSRAATPSR